MWGSKHLEIDVCDSGSQHVLRLLPCLIAFYAYHMNAAFAQKHHLVGLSFAAKCYSS